MDTRRIGGTFGRLFYWACFTWFSCFAFFTGAQAGALSADIAPDAAETLLLWCDEGGGDRKVRIEDVYYSCSGGKAFAIVRSGGPEDADEAGEYDVVKAGELDVYVPRGMSFENGVPRIVTFPRKNGVRDVGVPNVIR